jgi:hypothetical protein
LHFALALALALALAFALAFPFAVVFSHVRRAHTLPLPVPAVILSVAKDPEALDDPPPSEPSQPESQQSWFSSPKKVFFTKNCHFDRSWSRSHREHRSGEIRFSTPHPLQRRCLVLFGLF